MLQDVRAPVGGGSMGGSLTITESDRLYRHAYRHVDFSGLLQQSAHPGIQTGLGWELVSVEHRGQGGLRLTGCAGQREGETQSRRN